MIPCDDLDDEDAGVEMEDREKEIGGMRAKRTRTRRTGGCVNGALSSSEWIGTRAVAASEATVGGSGAARSQESSGVAIPGRCASIGCKSGCFSSLAMRTATSVHKRGWR